MPKVNKKKKLDRKDKIIATLHDQITDLTYDLKYEKLERSQLGEKVREYEQKDEMKKYGIQREESALRDEVAYLRRLVRDITVPVRNDSAKVRADYPEEQRY